MATNRANLIDALEAEAKRQSKSFVNTAQLIGEIYDDLSNDERQKYKRILKAHDDLINGSVKTLDSIGADGQNLATAREKYDHISRILAAIEAQAESFKHLVADLNQLIRDHNVKE